MDEDEILARQLQVINPSAFDELIELLIKVDSNIQVGDKSLFFLSGEWSVVNVERSDNESIDWLYRGDDFVEALKAVQS